VPETGSLREKAGRKGEATRSRGVITQPNTSELPSRAKEATAQTTALINVIGYAYMEEEVLVAVVIKQQCAVDWSLR
jgi:hypothetical protein